jgi:hypothetical protein
MYATHDVFEVRIRGREYLIFDSPVASVCYKYKLLVINSLFSLSFCITSMETLSLSYTNKYKSFNTCLVYLNLLYLIPTTTRDIYAASLAIKKILHTLHTYCAVLLCHCTMPLHLCLFVLSLVLLCLCAVTCYTYLTCHTKHYIPVHTSTVRTFSHCACLW